MEDAPQYSVVARDYYDPVLHPTCWNFRQLGLLGFKEAFGTFGSIGDLEVGRVLETGAGKSSVVESFQELGISSKNVVLQDISPEMLSHSHKWQNQINSTFISDARNMPIEDRSFDFVFSFLVDPYDTSELKNEIFRVVREKSYWIITTPSFEWSNRFRDVDSINKSLFLDDAGNEFQLDSYLYDISDRVGTMKNAGFGLKFFKLYNTSHISGPVSQKLLGAGQSEPVLEFFVFQRD